MIHYILIFLFLLMIQIFQQIRLLIILSHKILMTMNKYKLKQHEFYAIFFLKNRAIYY